MIDIPLQIKFDDESRETAEVYVDGIIHGESYRFLLDTGCARTTLIYNETTAQFPTTGTHGSSGAFGHRSEYDLIQINDLAIGSIAFKESVISRAKVGGTSRHLLGMDVLKSHRLWLSYQEGRVSMSTEPADQDVCEMRALVLERGLIPNIKAELAGTELNAVWDTGAGITVVDQRIIDNYPAAFERIGMETGEDSTGAKQETPAYLLNGLLLGGHVFSHHKVVAVDFSSVNSQIEIPMDMILGYSTLKQANWLFDFPRRKWGITAMLQ